MDGTKEREYGVVGDRNINANSLTGENKAISVNATVMAITLDFMEKNNDWYIITIHPIDPRRRKLVGNFLYKNIESYKFNIEEIEGVFNITRKIY
jgi:hypothetical protein